MTIHYRDGRTAEAVLLTLTDDVVRLAVKGAGDVEIFTKVNGTWISEQCEPVTLRLGKPQPPPPVLREEDFICPAALAAHLADLLTADNAALPDGLHIVPTADVRAAATIN